MAGAMKKSKTPGCPPKGQNGPNGSGGGTKTYAPKKPPSKRTGMK